MTRALSSYPKSERRAIAKKRVERATGGLGYWAARDYLAKNPTDKDSANKEPPRIEN